MDKAAFVGRAADGFRQGLFWTASAGGTVGRQPEGGLT